MDSLKKRYISKLGANLVSLITGGIITLFVPKALGPALFGVFNFITDFFHNILNFLLLGTQNAFYTKLSRDQKDIKLIKFYGGYLLLVIICAVFIVLSIYMFKEQNNIWPDVKLKYVIGGLLFGILTLLVSNIKIINDAIGITRASERMIVIQKLIGFIVILSIYLFHTITLNNFFLYHYFILVFLLILWTKELLKRKINPFLVTLSKPERKNYTKQFYNYSHPLIVFTIISLIVEIGDRWLLQKFGGSIQQGYFSLANRISGLCFIFTGAMSPLIMREFSIAYKHKNLIALGDLFRKNLPLLYFIGAFLSIFVAFNSDFIILIIGGNEYQGGSTAFMLMAFYPIQQSYGQLSGSLFYATDQTKLYRNIGVTVSIVGLLTTFFLIAPEALYGLNLGATGLAIKKLVIQFLGVSTGLYFNTKYLGLSFKKFMGHKILIVILLSMIVYGTNFFSGLIFSSNIYLTFVLSGFLYTGMVILLVFMYPRIVAQDKESILKLTAPIVKFFNK